MFQVFLNLNNFNLGKNSQHVQTRERHLACITRRGKTYKEVLESTTNGSFENSAQEDLGNHGKNKTPPL